MNLLEAPLFDFLSITAIVSSVVTVTNRKPAYGVLALIVTMLALATLFVLLQAYFVAAIQILIYAGAILVLFLFVIMLLGVKETDVKKEMPSFARVIQLLLALAFIIELLAITLSIKATPFPKGDFVGTVEAVGEALFSNYLLPFELVSGILLIGIFGVVILTQRKLKKPSL